MLKYKGQRLNSEYVLDLICFGKIVVVELRRSLLFSVFSVYSVVI